MQISDDLRIATLLDAYRAADYRWELDRRWHLLHIGERAPQLEEAFPEARSFALVSAWDPQSVPRPEAANRSADEALHSALLASGLPFRPGFSSAANRSWREPSWVVMDVGVAELDRLARRFDQLGALFWLRGEPVGLRMYARQPAAIPARDCVAWVPAIVRPVALGATG